MVIFGRQDPDVYSAIVTTSAAASDSSAESAARAAAEYEAMRATIRQRGTLRLALLPVIFIGWAVVAVATAAVITVALSTLVPLMALAAGFEAIFALHVNVERVGRYLQVFHERPRGGWEHVAMEFGRRFPGSGPDPLFARLFIFATSVNFFPAALGGEAWEVLVIGVCHLGLIFRIRKAQSFAAAQRAEDLHRFETLLGATLPRTPTETPTPPSPDAPPAVEP